MVGGAAALPPSVAARPRVGHGGDPARWGRGRL